MWYTPSSMSWKIVLQTHCFISRAYDLIFRLFYNVITDIESVSYYIKQQKKYSNFLSIASRSFKGKPTQDPLVWFKIPILWTGTSNVTLRSAITNLILDTSLWCFIVSSYATFFQYEVLLAIRYKVCSTK